MFWASPRGLAVFGLHNGVMQPMVAVAKMPGAAVEQGSRWAVRPPAVAKATKPAVAVERTPGGWLVEGWCPVSCKVASMCRSKGNSKVCPHRNRRIGSLREILGVKVPENVLNSTIAPVGSEGNAVKGNHEGAVSGVTPGNYRLQQLQQSSVQQWAYATWKKSVSNCT